MSNRYWVESNDGRTAILRVAEGRTVAGDGDRYIYKNTDEDINLSSDDFYRFFPVHGFVTGEQIAELAPAPVTPWAPDGPEQPTPDQSQIDAADSASDLNPMRDGYGGSSD